MRALFIAFLVGILLSGCRSRKGHLSVTTPPPSATTGNTLVSGTVIKATGSWTNVDSSAIRNLAVTPSGKRVEWKHSSTGGSAGNSTTSGSIELSSPSDPWFIFVEAPDVLWFCDGARNLSCRDWRGRGSNSNEVILHGKPKASTDTIPAELIPLLPAEMQKLLPESTGKKRPSI